MESFGKAEGGLLSRQAGERISVACMRAVEAQLLSQGTLEQAQEPGPAVEADEPSPSPIRVQCRLA